MNILIVVRTLKVGGMERVAVNLADAFCEAGHHCHVVYFKKVSDQVAPENKSIPVHYFPLSQKLRATGVGLVLDLVARLLLNPIFRKSHFLWVGWLSGLLFKSYVKKLEQKHGLFDLIIFRGQGTFEAIWGWKDERHRFVLENIQHNHGDSLKQKLMARALFDRRHLVAVSEGVKSSAEASFARLSCVPASIKVISNPCPIASIVRQSNQNDPGVPQEPYIVHVARLVPQKDQAMLLKAYQLADIEEKLVIVGDGPLRAELMQLAEALGIASRVSFVGSKLNPYPWMKAAKCLVLSSAYEGLGIVFLEALACGTPILSVDCPGGVRDVFKGDLEKYLTPHTAEGLAAGLRALLQSERGVSVEAHWLDDFKPDRVVEKFLATVR